MLTELHLLNFKGFDDATLPLRPLTLLTGTNGGGKSSVIQALALLGHTLAAAEWSNSLLLETPDLALGSAGDVLNQRGASRHITMGASVAQQRVEWVFDAKERSWLSMPLRSVAVDGHPLPVAPPLRWLLPVSTEAASPVVEQLRSIGWITAERVGPRELLPLRDEAAHAKVGPRGELAAGLMYWRADEPVRPAVCQPGAAPTLFHQVRAQMQRFFPGSDFKVAQVSGTSSVTLSLRSHPSAEFQRPQNVGFGLTQLFPILVAVLSAKPGTTLLIENPEVHLHPRAQQQIGQLMAMVAANGVQIIVETHSDHVLNGLRLAVKQGRGLADGAVRQLRPGDVAIHYFSPPADGGAVRPVSPTVDEDGRLSEWPVGFFDQLDDALSALM